MCILYLYYFKKQHEMFWLVCKAMHGAHIITTLTPLTVTLS